MKVWMRKSESEPFDYLCVVDEYRYNEDRPGWDYKIKDESGIKSEDGEAAWIEETNLKEA